MRPDVTFLQERVCDCSYRKGDKQSVYVKSFLQVSCSSKETVVQHKRSNCTVSAIRLSPRLDWRKFAFTLATQLQTFLLKLSA